MLFCIPFQSPPLTLPSPTPSPLPPTPPTPNTAQPNLPSFTYTSLFNKVVDIYYWLDHYSPKQIMAF